MPLRRRRLRPRPVQQLINYALDTLIYEYLLSPYGARAYNQLDMICYICMYVFFPSSNQLHLGLWIVIDEAHIFVCHCLFLMYQLTSNVWATWIMSSMKDFFETHERMETIKKRVSERVRRAMCNGNKLSCRHSQMARDEFDVKFILFCKIKTRCTNTEF